MKISTQPLAALRALLPLAALVTVIVTGVLLGVEVMLLVLAFFSLIGVILLLWSSVQSLAGQSPLTLDEALTLAAPSAEEEQKRAALRALKDIEYERSVGKISEQDYREFSERYRADARRLIAAVDASLGPAQAQAEKLANARLASAGLSTEVPATAQETAPAPTQETATAQETAPAPAPATVQETEP